MKDKIAQVVYLGGVAHLRDITHIWDKKGRITGRLREKVEGKVVRVEHLASQTWIKESSDASI